MGFYPIDPGIPVHIQSSVNGVINIIRRLAEQTWLTPEAADDDQMFGATAVDADGQMMVGIDNLGAVAQALIVTVGGVAGDVKAGNVIVTGTSAANAPLFENFLLTVNTIGAIQGLSLFKTVTSILVPLQDGPGVTVKVGNSTDAARVLPVETVPAAGQLYVLGDITAVKQPDYPRGLELTVDGVAADIPAKTVTVYGTNFADEAISEVFLMTLNTATVVQGLYAFKKVTKVLAPAMDGAGVTLKLGVNEKLGLNTRLPANFVVYAILNGTLEAVAPAVTTNDTDLEKNTIDLTSALGGTAVQVGFMV